MIRQHLGSNSLLFLSSSSLLLYSLSRLSLFSSNVLSLQHDLQSRDSKHIDPLPLKLSLSLSWKRWEKRRENGGEDVLPSPTMFVTTSLPRSFFLSHSLTIFSFSLVNNERERERNDSCLYVNFVPSSFHSTALHPKFLFLSHFLSLFSLSLFSLLLTFSHSLNCVFSLSSSPTRKSRDTRITRTTRTCRWVSSVFSLSLSIISFFLSLHHFFSLPFLPFSHLLFLSRPWRDTRKVDSSKERK